MGKDGKTKMPENLVAAEPNYGLIMGNLFWAYFVI